MEMSSCGFLTGLPEDLKSSSVSMFGNQVTATGGDTLQLTIAQQGEILPIISIEITRYCVIYGVVMYGKEWFHLVTDLDNPDLYRITTNDRILQQVPDAQF
jgi:hypothetical protein